MKCLDRFNKKMDYSGGSLRNENIKNSRELLQETFSNDASFAIGMYFWELGIQSYDSKPTVGIRLYDRSFSNANGWTVKFQTLHENPIITGDVIYDSKSDEYFICTESFNIDDIHWQGKLTLCNWVLRWQDVNGKILEYPCHDINSTQYNSGEQSNKQFTIGSSQHMITLPFDDNTVMLSSPQRFYLDKNKINPTSFVVTQNDSTSYNYGKKGLVKLTLYECANDSETDRPDLGICDYIDINNIDNTPTSGISKAVISYDTKIIKSGGDSQIYIGKFYDDEGNEISDIIPVWDIICDFKNYLEVVQSDNQISIGIDNDYYVDEEFKLVLSDKDNRYSSTLLIKIESLI